MSRRVGHAAFAAIDVDRIVDLTRRLIDVASPTGDELGCAQLLVDFFERHHVPVELQRFGDRRANVVARTGDTADGIRLMLCGHMDTTALVMSGSTTLATAHFSRRTRLTLKFTGNTLWDLEHSTKRAV